MLPSKLSSYLTTSSLPFSVPSAHLCPTDPYFLARLTLTLGKSEPVSDSFTVPFSFQFLRPQPHFVSLLCWGPHLPIPSWHCAFLSVTLLFWAKQQNLRGLNLQSSCCCHSRKQMQQKPVCNHRVQDRSLPEPERDLAVFSLNLSCTNTNWSLFWSLGR